MIQIIYRVLSLLLVLVIYKSIAFADRREITFPFSDGIVSSQRTDLAFAHDGQIGFAIVYNQSTPSAKFFSFSVSDAKLISEINLTPDFSLADNSGISQAITLNVHNNTGLVVVSGKDSNTVQKLMALSADKTGHLRKLWISSFPATSFFLQVSNLSFNPEGSRIYFIYSSDVEQNELFPQEHSTKPHRQTQILLNRILPGLESGSQFVSYSSSQVRTSSAFRQHLALIRTEDGATLATADLSMNQTSSIMYNEARRRPIVLSHGRVFILSPESDLLEVEYVIEPPAEFREVAGQAFSQDGRFLIGYAGFTIESTKKGQNNYVSYDLELGDSHYLSIENTHFPIANGLVFHAATGNLYVPLSVKMRITPGGAFVLVPSGSRLTDVISLTTGGSLARVGQVKIPNRSPGSPNPNRIWLETNSAAISTTGALGFLSSQNGYLFTFDTLTGEIINDELIDPETISSIHLLEPMGLLVTSNLTNKLLLVDVSTGPVIKGVQIKNARTIIKGTNFLSGVRVEIDGVDVGSANRNQENPGREIIIERGKKDFPRGQVLTVVVTNRDGLSSTPFTFTR